MPAEMVLVWKCATSLAQTCKRVSLPSKARRGVQNGAQTGLSRKGAIAREGAGQEGAAGVGARRWPDTVAREGANGPKRHGGQGGRLGLKWQNAEA